MSGSSQAKIFSYENPIGCRICAFVRSARTFALFLCVLGTPLNWRGNGIHAVGAMLTPLPCLVVALPKEWCLQFSSLIQTAPSSQRVSIGVFVEDIPLACRVTGLKRSESIGGDFRP